MVINKVLKTAILGLLAMSLLGACTRRGFQPGSIKKAVTGDGKVTKDEDGKTKQQENTDEEGGGGEVLDEGSTSEQVVVGNLSDSDIKVVDEISTIYEEQRKANEGDENLARLEEVFARLAQAKADKNVAAAKTILGISLRKSEANGTVGVIIEMLVDAGNGKLSDLSMDGNVTVAADGKASSLTQLKVVNDDSENRYFTDSEKALAYAVCTSSDCSTISVLVDIERTNGNKITAAYSFKAGQGELMDHNGSSVGDFLSYVDAIQKHDPTHQSGDQQAPAGDQSAAGGDTQAPARVSIEQRRADANKAYTDELIRKRDEAKKAAAEAGNEGKSAAGSDSAASAPSTGATPAASGVTGASTSAAAAKPSYQQFVDGHAASIAAAQKKTYTAPVHKGKPSRHIPDATYPNAGVANAANSNSFYVGSTSAAAVKPSYQQFGDGHAASITAEQKAAAEAEQRRIDELEIQRLKGLVKKGGSTEPRDHQP